MHKHTHIVYTAAAKARSFDPYNSAVNFEPAFGSKYKSKKQHARFAVSSKRTNKYV